MSESVHILYMEDNEGTARLLQKRLSRDGYRIDIVSNGEAGLERYAAHPYHAILLDYNMPGLNGLQVLQRLADQGGMPPTIMLTGTGNERVAVDALKLGAFDYVIKDIDGIYLDLLPTVIEQALRNQQLLEDKRRAEAALKESEERFRLLFERAPDPYFINDLAGNLIDCNQAVEYLLGLSRESLIGQKFPQMQLFDANYLKKVADDLTNPPQVAQSESSELTIARTDGVSVVVALSMIPMQVKGETHILSIGHDITWRKRLEMQMQMHIEQLETLHHIDDGLTRRLDPHYVQNMALDSMMSLSGANAGSIALMNEQKIPSVHAVGYPENLDQHYSLDQRSVAARVARQQKAEWVQDVTTDPDYFAALPDTCSQIVIPLMSQSHLMGIVSLETNRPDGFNAEMYEFLKLIAARIAGAIENAQLYDSTQKHLVELQTLYERISNLEQLKTDMIRIASHDLRNPLTTISTNVFLLRKTVWSQLSEKAQDQINAIERAAKQMEAITADFLSLERIGESAQDGYTGQNFDLRETALHIFERYQLQSAGKSQHYRFSAAETPLLVKGNRAELQQAIDNLLGNAVKYTPEGGTIEVSLQRGTDTARLEVVDTGYGIPPEQQEYLFQPFFRAQTEKTASIEGTGLGLSIVKKIVEKNGGQLIFHSEYGKGSTFGFELPLS